MRTRLQQTERGHHTTVSLCSVGNLSVTQDVYPKLGYYPHCIGGAGGKRWGVKRQAAQWRHQSLTVSVKAETKFVVLQDVMFSPLQMPGIKFDINP